MVSTAALINNDCKSKFLVSGLQVKAVWTEGGHGI